MDIKSISELAEPDPMMLRLKVFRTTPEEACRFHQEDIASCDLVTDVPEELRRSFDRVRQTFVYGFFAYDLCTVANTLGLLLLEEALAIRFITRYAGAIPLVKGHEEATLTAHSLSQVYEALTGSGLYAARGWKLRLAGSNGTMSFRASLGDLVDWARREELLSGQRSRGLEKLYLRMRNRAAHPSGFTRLAPSDAARTIHDLAQIINRLWGHRTRGGRLYPDSIERDVLLLGWDAGAREIAYGLPDAFRRETPDDSCRVVVLRANFHDGGLHEYESLFESTVYPVELLYGPTDCGNALQWVDREKPTNDRADYLDRVFVVPLRDREPELARRPSVFLGLPIRARRGNWAIVKADHGIDAWAHVRYRHMPADGGHTKGMGPCAECPTETIFIGRNEQVTARLGNLGYDCVEQPPHVDLRTIRYGDGSGT